MARREFFRTSRDAHPLVRPPAATLQSLIAKTKLAISMEESCYTLNSGLLIRKPDTIAMVATDGHPPLISTAPATALRFILPAKTGKVPQRYNSIRKTNDRNCTRYGT
jgi:DNA polymerase III sliding clamp (beta) subunit (PCNA family)